MAKDTPWSFFAPCPSLAIEAIGYEQWSVVNLLLHVVSGLGVTRSNIRYEVWDTDAGPLQRLCVLYKGQNSGILEEWVSFVTALEHCLPTNVN